MNSFLLACATFLISLNTFAKFPIVDVKDVSGQYENNRGRAYAESAKYDLTEAIISHERINVDFFKPEKNLILRNDSTTVELNFDVSFMNVFKAFQFNLVNINSTSETFNLNSHKLILDITPTKYTVNKLELQSNVEGKVSSGQDFDLIQGFLISGEINIKSIFFGIISRDEFINLIKEENPKQISEVDSMFSAKGINLPVVARNLRLVVEKGNFSGSVYLDSWLNTTLYLGGQVEYLPSQDLLNIKLWKARAGYFSIRKIILGKIASMNLDAVSVRGSTISIKLGKKSSDQLEKSARKF